MYLVEAEIKRNGKSYGWHWTSATNTKKEAIREKVEQEKKHPYSFRVRKMAPGETL